MWISENDLSKLMTNQNYMTISDFTAHKYICQLYCTMENPAPYKLASGGRWVFKNNWKQCKILFDNVHIFIGCYDNEIDNDCKW